MTHLWGTADTAPRRAAPTRSCPPHLMTSSGGLAAPWCQTTFWCNFFWRKKVWPVQDQFVAPEIFDIFFEFYFFGNLRKITFFFFDISNNSKYFCFQKWFYRFQWFIKSNDFINSTYCVFFRWVINIFSIGTILHARYFPI